MEPIIEMTGVGFHYRPDETPRDRWALQGVDLMIRSGEYVAIMGPNGSGKSTLAKMMNALLVPVEGSVRVDGRETGDPKTHWEIRRKVGMVFQNPDNQIVATTVRDDVAFGLENLGVPREEMIRRVEAALRQVGLEGLEERPSYHLSGGQKQRLAIAGVIAMQPRVVVFDEATSMLDPAGRREVLDVIGRMKERGTTVVHITHSAREAALADRVVVMAGGRIRMQGTPAEVFQQTGNLRKFSLETPLHVELLDRLRRRGMPIRSDPVNSEEWVEEIWRLLSKG